MENIVRNGTTIVRPRVLLIISSPPHRLPWLYLISCVGWACWLLEPFGCRTLVVKRQAFAPAWQSVFSVLHFFVVDCRGGVFERQAFYG